MASEDTSLLSTPEDNGVYLRFSDFRKSIILAMVSGCTMINCTLIYSASESHLISNTRFSGWIVYTFHTTDCKGPRFIRRACQVIKYLFRKTGYNSYFLSLAASMSVFASALGALIVASYSTFCKFSLNPVLFSLTWFLLPPDGRRPVYLYTLPVFAIGSAGVAASQSIHSLLFWRFFQSIGASIGPVIGAAVIGDIFKLEERGGAMGVSFSVGDFLIFLFINDPNLLTWFFFLY